MFGLDYNIAVGVCSILILLVLIFMGCHLGISFLVVGLGGTYALTNFRAMLGLGGETMYNFLASPTFCVLPMFMLMGSLAARGGFARMAFESVHTICARIPASLAIASAFGSAIFGAICGSTMATAAIFGRLAYPAMREHHYDRRFALGSIASSGTFACMIPPSGMFIIFSMFTGISIVELFFSGFVPGILTAVVYAISMYIRAKRNPRLAPISEEEMAVRAPQRAKAAFNLWPIIVLATVVLGGLYSGFFTATEAGAVGALGALLLGFQNGSLRKKGEVTAAMRESARATTMLLFIVVTALVFSRFLAITQVPSRIADFLLTWDMSPKVTVLLILVIWFFLGMFMNQTSIFALTLPVLFPIIVKLGINPIWFCIVAMKLNEIAAVSPPVGMNVFGLVGSVREVEEVSVEDAYMGCFPFLLCDLIVIVLLFIFPEIATYVPDLMMGRL